MRRVRMIPLVAAILFALTLTSCAEDRTPLEPGESPNALLGDLTKPLTGSVSKILACPTSDTYTETKTIGRSGGTIKVGPHTLAIPKNALKEDVEITATAPAGDITTIQFEPHGLRFARKAALTMSYAHCPLISSLTKWIVYIDDDLDILEVLPSVNDVLRQRVTGDLEHFSAYAVAE